MPDLCPSDLDQMEARVNAATAGPWAVWNQGAPDGIEVVGYYRDIGMDESIHAHNRDYCRRFCVVHDGVTLHRYAQPLLDMGGDPVDTRGQVCDDADFIAHAREDMPRLIAALRAAWARIEALEKGIDDFGVAYAHWKTNRGGTL